MIGKSHLLNLQPNFYLPFYYQHQLKEARKALLMITWLASAVEMKHFTVFVAAEYTCPWFISMLKFQQGKK